jgi:hypothetical protein
MYITISCYQLIIGKAIWLWDLVQLLLGNKTLSVLVYWNNQQQLLR